MLDRYKKLIIGGVLLAIAVLAIPTLSEFLVALWNRYQTYPAGTDASMLAAALILELIWLLVASIAILRYVFSYNWIATVGLGLLLAGVLWWIMLQGIPSFLPRSWCAYELRIYSCQDFINNPQWPWNGIL